MIHNNGWCQSVGYKLRKKASCSLWAIKSSGMLLGAWCCWAQVVICKLKSRIQKKKEIPGSLFILGLEPNGVTWRGKRWFSAVGRGQRRGDHTTRVRRGAASCLRHACRMNYKLGNIQSSPSSRENWSQPQGTEGAFTVRYSFGAAMMSYTAQCWALGKCIVSKTPSDVQKHTKRDCLSHGWVPQGSSHAELIGQLLSRLSTRSAEVTVSH